MTQNVVPKVSFLGFLVVFVHKNVASNLGWSPWTWLWWLWGLQWGWWWRWWSSGMYQYTAECTAWLCVISQFDSEVKFDLDLCLFKHLINIISTGSATIQHQNDQCNIQHQCEHGHGELDKIKSGSPTHLQSKWDGEPDKIRPAELICLKII